MGDAPELLPCPFCGSAKVFFYHLHRQATHRHHPFVLCHGCSARINGEEGDYGVDATTAVAAWNTRTDLVQSQIDAAVAEEREACAEVAMRLSETYANRAYDVAVPERYFGKRDGAMDVTAAIRARGSTDALAKRDARIREEALREAASIAAKYAHYEPGGITAEWIEYHILALIPDTDEGEA
jgi:hypothetical protein